MRYWTYAEALSKIQKEMDMQEEDSESFVKDTEWMEYFNDAIDETEQEIMKLYQWYLKSYATANLVSGTADIDMPSDIYANKIIHIDYDNGTRRYQIHRAKVEEIAELQSYTGTDPIYKYGIQFTTVASGPKIVLYPTPQANETAPIKIHYIRNANRMTGNSDIFDIPEAMGFIFAHVKVRVAGKEMSPMLPNYMAELERHRGLLRSTLDNMTLDNSDLPIPTDFYEEMS